MPEPTADPNLPVRMMLRRIGTICLPIGLILTIIAAVNLFTSHGVEPKLFWLGFIGLPLIFVGAVCLGIGFQRTISKYTAREMTPVFGESAKQIAQELRPTVQQFAKDIHDNTQIDNKDPVARMQQLETLKQQDLISETEYQDKRTEILKDV